MSERSRTSEPSSAKGPPPAEGATPAIESMSAALPTPWVTDRVARLLALATGFLYFLAFPGVDLWPLAFVTWVPLLVAMRGRNARSAMRLAWLSGFVMTFVGFYWMLHMLRAFSGFPTAVCILLMALLALYQGGRIALFGWLANRLQELGWWRGPSLGLAFATSEVAFPLLFPWYFGATVHQLPALLQPAELGGPILVGLLLFGVNAALADVVGAKLSGERASLRWLGVHGGLVALCAALGFGRMAMVDQAAAAAPHGKVGVVQANLGLMEKRLDREEGLQRHLALSHELEREGPLDLIVWSETSVAGAVYEHEAQPVYQRLVTGRLESPVLFGALLLREVKDARRVTVFNSALLGPAGAGPFGRYDKQVLLAFGEYLPLGDQFPVLYEWSPNTGKFSPGTRMAALPLGERKLSVHICYEDVLPTQVNDLVTAEGADLLVNLTNDAWYGDTTQPWVHLALAKFRAIEHRRYFVRSTNSGVSAFIDANGRVLAHTGTFEQASLARPVAYLSTGPTPFELLGHGPYWAGALLSLVGAFVPRRLIGRRAS